MIECALAAPYTAKIEAQHGKVPVHERIIQLIDDLVVHRATELRVRVEHDPDRGIPLPGRVIAAFETPAGAGEDDLGHGCQTSIGVMTHTEPRRKQAPLADGGGRCT